MFVTASLALSSVFRGVALWRVGIPSLTVADPPGAAQYATALTVGVLQDAAVIATLLVVGRILLRVGVRAATVVVTALVAGVLWYYWLDLLLVVTTRLRMSASLFSFLRYPKPLVDSAIRVGIGWVFVGGAVIAVVTTRYRGTLGAAAASMDARRRSIGLGIVILAAIGTRLESNTAHYGGSNILFRDIVDAAVERDKKATVIPPPVPDALAPRGELYERVDSAYPLLKRTLGFSGPTRFELAVAPDEQPHVVILFMESFRAADVGALGAPHRPSATPRFDALATEGVLFSNYYANGVQTTRGVIASLFGIVPRFTRRAVQSEDPDLPLIGIADLLGEQGYRTAYFHNGSLEFERKSEFFAAHGYDEIHGRQDVMTRHPDAPRMSWGVHDEFLMRDIVDWLGAQDDRGEPSFVTAFTVSNHHPWLLPDGHEPPRFERPPEGEHADYLGTLHYSDQALGRFVDLLRERDLASRTILFILADTAQPMGEHDDNHMLVRHVYQENLRIPLLIWADGRIDTPVRIPQPASQIDILPTVMDILRLEGVNHATGSSLRRAIPDRIVPFNNPFHLRFRGGVLDVYKYVWSPVADAEAVYRLDRDPGERQPLGGVPAEADRLRTAVREVGEFMDWMYRARAFYGAAVAPVQRWRR